MHFDTITLGTTCMTFLYRIFCEFPFPLFGIFIIVPLLRIYLLSFMLICFMFFCIRNCIFFYSSKVFLKILVKMRISIFMIFFFKYFFLKTILLCHITKYKKVENYNQINIFIVVKKAQGH